MKIFRLRNKIQHYAWGSETLMTRYFGIPNPDHEPQAEMWMGAHRSAPSEVSLDDGITGLDELIRRDPLTVLGRNCSSSFDGKLPFLFKILAAGQPLSIQAHPDKLQAEEGFKRENAAGVDIKSPERNYRDDNHKPEIICAVSEFQAMCGFRTAAEINDFFRQTGNTDLNAVSEVLLQKHPESLKFRMFFDRLMNLKGRIKNGILESLINWARSGDSPEQQWIVRLVSMYPDDIAVLSPLYLNLIVLKPGQAICLKAGILHAYLSGIGIELMANSDNVLRGGLTVKHVDLRELGNVLDFSPFFPNVRDAGSTEPNKQFCYRTAADEFMLSVLNLDGEYRFSHSDSPFIILCADGSAAVNADENRLLLGKGESAYICPSSRLWLKGKGRLFIAGLPTAESFDA